MAVAYEKSSNRTICVIGFDDDKVIKDFIRLHVEQLSGEKVCINHWFPDLKYRGRLIRSFYSKNKLRSKLLKLIPQFLFHRMVASQELSPKSLENSFEGFFRNFQVDAILAEFGENGASITPIAKKLGLPLLVHFHGHDAHRKPLFTESYLASYKQMFQYASAVFSVSSMMRESLLDLGCPSEKLIYNPYGPRETFFRIRPSYSPNILSVGRFTDIKANYLVLMAFKDALASCPQATLTMAGDGELLETCKTLSRVWNLESHVKFLGAVNHSQVSELFADCCAFAQHSVTPSYGDAEGTPNTILEACASGLPVVSTYHAGIKDVVVDGQTGYLVQELDVKVMGQRFAELLTSPDLCKAMGEKGRARIAAHFTVNRHIQRIDEAIGFAIEGNHQAIGNLAEVSLAEYRAICANGIKS